MTQRLFDRLKSIGKVPTPPSVVLDLLELTQREDVSSAEISDTLARDPILAAKILRFANSPMAGIRREVTSLQHAVVLMGVRGVKMTALSFAAVGLGGVEVCRGFDPQQFSVQSIGCAVAARAFATETGSVGQQDAFLAGLLSQIGRSALASGLPEEYGDVLAKAQQIPRDLPDLERAALGDSYPVIGAQLLRSWRIPEALCASVEKFRQLDEEVEVPVLAKILHVAEIAAGIVCPDAKEGQPDPRAVVDAAHKLLGIEENRCPQLMHEIATEVENARLILEVPAGNLRDPDDLQNEVRERIAELSLAMHLENQTMANQQEELMRRATTDTLTGIGNRAAFNARLSLEMERCARSGAPLALFMIDVDKFKSFNDTYGHQAGDLVLQTVARALDENIRKVDYVARYGGEEFAAIVPDPTEDGVLALAERLRHSVEQASVEWERKTLSVTISIGVAICGGVINGVDGARILRIADSQLYAAKSGGRNRVEMTAMDDSTTVLT